MNRSSPILQKRIAPVFLILVMLSMFLALVPSLPPAHALAFDAQCNNNVGGASLTVTCQITFTVNEFVIMSGEAQLAVGCGGITSSESDNSGFTSWTQDTTASDNVGGAACYWSAVGHAQYTHTGSTLVTFTFTIAGTAAANVAEISLQVYAITIPAGPSITTSTGTGDCTACTGITSSVASFSQENKVTVAGWMTIAQGAGPAWTAGSGFTLYPSGGNPAAGSVRGFGTYNLAPSGPTTIGNTITQGSGNIHYSIAAASYGTGYTSLPVGVNCAHAVSCTSLLFNSTANTVLVVGVQCTNNCQGVLPFSGAGTSLTDTFGNTFTLQSQISTCNVIGPCSGNTSVASGIYTANAIVNGNGDKVTFKYGGGGQASLGMEIYDVSGVSATPSCTATGFSPGSTSITTSSTCVTPANSLVFSSLSTISATLTAGATFTLTTSGQVFAGTQEASGSGGLTNFPGTLSASDHVSNAGIVLSPVNSPTGSAVIGSCPGKNTATFTLVNNTEYLYLGAALAGETINSLSTFVSSVTSVATAQSLTFGIYTSSGTTINALNPLTLQAQFSKTLTAGSKNTGVNWNSGFFVNVPAGSTIAIAVLGTSKIVLNQSSFGGLNTGSTSGGVLASSLTSITQVATQIYFCAAASYQVSSTVTATTTVTSFSTISQGTTTVTTTTTATSLNQQVLVTGSVNFSVLLILILGPAVLMGGVFGAIAKSGVAALGGAAVGLGLGAAIGNLSGLIPLWIVGVIVLFIVFLIVLAFAASDRGGGG